MPYTVSDLQPKRLWDSTSEDRCGMNLAKVGEIFKRSASEEVTEAGEFPFLLLTAAMDGSGAGLLVYDAEFRLLHMSNEVPRLLDLGPIDPGEELTVFRLLTKSALEDSCLDTAQRLIAEFARDQVVHSFGLR